MKIAQTVKFATVYGETEVDAALAAASEANRSAEGDLASTLRGHRRSACDGGVVPLVNGHSLHTCTGSWNEVGQSA